MICVLNRTSFRKNKYVKRCCYYRNVRRAYWISETTNQIRFKRIKLRTICVFNSPAADRTYHAIIMFRGNKIDVLYKRIRVSIGQSKTHCNNTTITRRTYTTRKIMHCYPDDRPIRVTTAKRTYRWQPSSFRAPGLRISRRRWRRRKNARHHHNGRLSRLQSPIQVYTHTHTHKSHKSVSQRVPPAPSLAVLNVRI